MIPLDDKYIHPLLGEVTVVRSRRSRRISLSVRPPQGRVRLSYPWGVPLAEALSFLDKKTDWVQKAQSRMEQTRQAEQIQMPFATRNHELRLLPDPDAEKITGRVAGEDITVKYPAEKSYLDPEVQEAIKKSIEQAWRKEAQELLPARLSALSAATGLKFKAVNVRNTRSKWGSCSPRNDISLSLHLMRLPDHLIDYILLHELCHTRHHNHGASFHALLDRLTSGRHLEYRKELKSYRTVW